MMKETILTAAGLFLVACGQTDVPSNPSQVPHNASSSTSAVIAGAPTSPAKTLVAHDLRRIGFGFNGTVSGFPTGAVFVTGGGAFERTSHVSDAAGGFRCVEAVLQGPLSVSINPDHAGACLEGDGIRWDTAAVLDSTTFKCTAAATEETAVTSSETVVLQADFYRTGDGNDESFTAKMIVSNGDISTRFPGANLWVQGVGCGHAQAVNFSN
jgi:hypothetical protein